eukprot:15431423-Heterocapsa_arctica.AAC.1
MGDFKNVRVFTIDTSDNQVYDGDMIPAPAFADGQDEQSWATSFNYANFEKVPSWGVINGLSASSLGALHQLDAVRYISMEQNGAWECQSVLWEATMEDKAGG